MSLRPRLVVASVACSTRLQHVLQAGSDVQALTESVGLHITINGIEISTDPTNWSPLLVEQMVKLELTPLNRIEFDRKGQQGNGPNSAYIGTQFKSNVTSPYYGLYRFWVVNLGYQRDRSKPTYMVLARPLDDKKVYTL